MTLTDYTKVALTLPSPKQERINTREFIQSLPTWGAPIVIGIEGAEKKFPNY